MSGDLVKTPNGTFVTREVAEAAGLEVKATRKTAARRKSSTSKTTAKRKAAGVSRRKGKR